MQHRLFFPCTTTCPHPLYNNSYFSYYHHRCFSLVSWLVKLQHTLIPAPVTLPYTQKPASLVCLQQQQGHKDHLPLPPKHSSCQAHPTITYNCLVPQKRASIQWVVRNSRCRALPSDCWQMHMLLLLLGKRWVGVSCACAHQHPCVPHTYTCDCKDTYTPPTPSPPPHPQTQVSAAEAMEAAVALIGITQAQLHDMTTKYATKLVRGDIVFVLG